MSPSLDILLPHYRRELDEAVARLARGAAPPCPPGEALLWAEAGEAAGWLRAEEAMARPIPSVAPVTRAVWGMARM